MSFLSGAETEDFGSFHYGLSASTVTSDEHPFPVQESRYNQDVEELQNSINENFGIGRPPAHSELRTTARDSMFAEFEQPDFNPYSINGVNNSRNNNNNSKPVGVVSPQATSFRDAFKVLPTNGAVDKSHLKPTMLNVKPRGSNEVRQLSVFISV